MASQKVKDAKALIIIAFNDYQDFEYKNTKKELRGAGVKTFICSSSVGTAKGKFRGETKVEILINEAKAEDYDAVIFIGGPGTVEFLNSDDAHRVAREAMEQEKIIGAICMAPQVLAKAGILKNKKSTVWASTHDKGGVEILNEVGAEYHEKDVLVDGNIVTANGPDAATKFGEKIVKLLLDRDK